MEFVCQLGFQSVFRHNCDRIILCFRKLGIHCRREIQEYRPGEACRRGGLISKASGNGSTKKGVKDGEETRRRCPQDKDRLPVGTGREGCKQVRGCGFGA